MHLKTETSFLKPAIRMLYVLPNIDISYLLLLSPISIKIWDTVAWWQSERFYVDGSKLQFPPKWQKKLLIILFKNIQVIARHFMYELRPWKGTASTGPRGVVFQRSRIVPTARANVLLSNELWISLQYNAIIHLIRDRTLKMDEGSVDEIK